MSKNLLLGLFLLGLVLGVGALKATAEHVESLSDFSMVGGLSPWVELGPMFQGTGNIADYDVTVENGYYFHDAGSPYHYLFFTARNVAVSPITYLVGYARAEQRLWALQGRPSADESSRPTAYRASPTSA